MRQILIIEDDEDLRPVLASVLRAEGFSVAEEMEGAAGIDAASKNPPDLIITDIVMEGMEGIAAIMALRGIFPDMPIIAISGNTLYLKSSVRLGADAALLKPFRREALLQTVNELLRTGRREGMDPDEWPSPLPA